VKPKICLIEDDPIMGEALVERLDMEGYACDWFQRGRLAVPSLLHKNYALAISDIRLPDISGEELFLELRQSGQPLPPFLFITGHGAIDQAVRLLKLGAEDYLTKPLDVPKLLDKVRSLSSSERVPCCRVSPRTLAWCSSPANRASARRSLPAPCMRRPIPPARRPSLPLTVGR
jgi:DNA-binding response OmpR family regulator